MLRSANKFLRFLNFRLFYCYGEVLFVERGQPIKTKKGRFTLPKYTLYKLDVNFNCYE